MHLTVFSSSVYSLLSKDKSFTERTVEGILVYRVLVNSYLGIWVSDKYLSWDREHFFRNWDIVFPLKQASLLILLLSVHSRFLFFLSNMHFYYFILFYQVIQPMNSIVKIYCASFEHSFRPIRQWLVTAL